jgi:hypothetical protein
MPVRKIPRSRRSLTGSVASHTSDSSSMFESSLERDLFTLLDFDSSVAGFEEQPICILFTDVQGCLRSYTPDVLIHYHPDALTGYQKPPLLAEVKYRQDLFLYWKDLKPKFKAARAHSREQGWQRFRIFTEVEIRTPYFDNAYFLRPFLRSELIPDDMGLLLSSLTTLRSATPQSLLLACSKDQMRRAELMPVLWGLIAQGHIGCDLDERLTMESPIWPLDSRPIT